MIFLLWLTKFVILKLIEFLHKYHLVIFLQFCYYMLSPRTDCELINHKDIYEISGYCQSSVQGPWIGEFLSNCLVVWGIFYLLPVISSPFFNSSKRIRIKMPVLKWWMSVSSTCLTFLIQLNKCFIKCLLFSQHYMHDQDSSEVWDIFLSSSSLEIWSCHSFNFLNPSGLSLDPKIIIIEVMIMDSIYMS